MRYLMLLLLLSGCDDYERQARAEDFKLRVFHACLPAEGERKVVVRDKDSIHFTTIDLSSGRYGRKFPHAEIRVATIEETE